MLLSWAASADSWSEMASQPREMQPVFSVVRRKDASGLSPDVTHCTVPLGGLFITSSP